MKASLYLVLASLFLACCVTTFAFVSRSALPSTRISTVSTAIRATRTRGVVTAGLFDGLFLSDTEKEDAYQKQQEILRARQNPEKQKAYFQEVNKRRATASQNFKEKFNLSKNGKQDPAVKWMELRKKGVIGEREKYEQYGETNRGIIIPQVPFGNTKYDEGERFDLRLPYVDEGYVDESASLGNTLKRLFGFGKESKPTTLPQGPGSDGPGAARGKGKSGYGGGKKK
eukprot:evm.model.NODE_27316_length_40306_cov_21.155485.2